MLVHLSVYSDAFQTRSNNQTRGNLIAPYMESHLLYFVENAEKKNINSVQIEKQNQRL